MNLQALFEAQGVLDGHITNEHPVQENENRLTKKILALQVELGECANEWRGFKFWSMNQKPVTVKFIDKKCTACNGSGEEPSTDVYHPCVNCYGTGVKGKSKNPLLEEYVDCLHFILSIGLDIEVLNITSLESILKFGSYQNREVQFVINKLFYQLGMMGNDDSSAALEYYPYVFQWFLELGYLLGFTWEQIEQAYFDKNQTNHERQNSGY